MADPESVEILRMGSAVWNLWRKQHPEIQPDLNGIGLEHIDLSRFDLSGTYLNHANLSEADLSGADLRVVHLNNANLRGTHLRSAHLLHAELRDADLRYANLVYANLNNADLRGAQLNHAITDSTIFAEMDLRDARGLAEIDHLGPSNISLHTILLPQDGSALHFLRGAGVPDEWIDFYRAQMMHPIQYHSCFISYANQDSTLAHRLHADLQAQGVRCWFAPEDMKIGERIRRRINEEIHVHEKLLLLLSEAAIQSDWVEDEVETALEIERRQQREVLFPIRLDDTVLETSQPWAAKLRRQRHIGDFTQWAELQAYGQAFERLLRDLKKADE